LTFKDQDMTCKDQDQDKDLTCKDKVKDKDFKFVLKDSSRTRTRTRTNITACKLLHQQIDIPLPLKTTNSPADVD
jgi:hypothetical protein